MTRPYRIQMQDGEIFIDLDKLLVIMIPSEFGINVKSNALANLVMQHGVKIEVSLIEGRKLARILNQASLAEMN